MLKKDEYLFVYGSLKTGKHNHGVLRGHDLSSSSYSIDGFIMYHMGGFPGIVRSNQEDKKLDVVYGELYRINQDIGWSRLDLLEGCRTLDEINNINLYNRIVVAETETSILYTYVWNGSVAGLKRIVSGNY